MLSVPATQERTQSSSTKEKRLSAFLEQRASVIRDRVNQKAQREDATKNALALVLNNDPKLKQLELMHIDYFLKMAPKESNTAFRTLATDICHNKHLTTVSLVNIGATDAFAEALGETLSKNSTLAEINLESNDIRGPGVIALASAVKESSSIVAIRLVHQKKPIPTEALNAMTEAVETNKITTVCTIDMRDRSMIHRLDKALRDNTDRKRKRRHSIRVAEGSFVAKLTAAQKIIKNLSVSSQAELDFTDSRDFLQMSDEWKIKRLCEGLLQNQSITKLSLAGLQLKDSFAVAFAKVLAVGTKLQEVNLERNSISGTGIKTIAEALTKSNSSGSCHLRRLRLNSQAATNSTAAEAAMVQAAQRVQSLTKIGLDWRNAVHRSSCEKYLMANADFARKSRQSGVSVRQGSSPRSKRLSQSEESTDPFTGPGKSRIATGRRPSRVAAAAAAFEAGRPQSVVSDVSSSTTPEIDAAQSTTDTVSMKSQLVSRLTSFDFTSTGSDSDGFLSPIGGEVSGESAGEESHASTDAESDVDEPSPNLTYEKLINAIDLYDNALPETSDKNEVLVNMVKSLSRSQLEYYPEDVEKLPPIVHAAQAGKTGAVAAFLYCGVRLGDQSGSLASMLYNSIVAKNETVDFTLIELLCDHGMSMDQFLNNAPPSPERRSHTAAELPTSSSKLEEWKPHPTKPNVLMIESILL